MRRRWILPAALAAVAALLGAYILLVDRRQATTDGARGAARRLLPEVARDDITAVEIDRTSDQTRDQTRDRTRQGTCTIARPGAVPDGGAAGAAWRVMPAGKPAGEAAVGDLLDAIDALEIDRETAAPPELTGLGQTDLVVAIATARGPAVRLRLGRRDASGRGLFVARQGDARAFVATSGRLRDLTERGCDPFRDRRLIPLPEGALAASATALAWQAAAGEATVTVQLRHGRWLNDRGDFAPRAAVAEALHQLGALTAVGFQPAPPAGAADRTLVVTAGDDRWTVRLWAQACDGTGARFVERERGGDRDGLCVDGVAIDRLWIALTATRGRETRLLAADTASIAGVSLAEGARRLNLRRERGVWRIAAPAVAYAADSAIVDDWLAGLTAMSITAVAPAPEPAKAAATPARQITVESPLGRETIDVAPPRGATTARVQRIGETTAASAPAALFAAIDPDPARFRSRAVFSFARHDVESVAISSPTGRLVARPVTPGGSGDWRIIQGADGGDRPADAAAIESLVTAVANLRAERFFATAPPFQAQRTIEVAAPIGSAAGAGPQRYGVELARPCLARVAGTPIFEVGAPQCADLWRSIETAN